MLARVSRTLARAAGHVQPHVQKGIPKVKDKEVTIHVVSFDGNKHVIKGFVGEPLVYALKKNLVPIGDACKGGDMNIPYSEPLLDTTSWGPSCSECQVVVDEPWINYMKPMGENEMYRLTKTPSGFFTPQSRLACCLIVEKWMDGMHLSVPYNIEPRPVGSDKPFDQGENRIHRF